ncbi:endonuclease/exonuclease/phosphatase family protein [Frigoriglobus tundricola]|uniref:Endonuclease/exonuclease/phosphatase domain-containing protein n=1 Tax=Frigoriglobus tundricola TaxID=2774151 RepID=A0A6M5YXC2_9BACT|nr:endonuclease/exonuclease/phosphatase family protein [Frigoriglobus tundricola]QJW98036.1 hypothetical protein FTUN_5616 [Frigoriglobus tundricola]
MDDTARETSRGRLRRTTALLSLAYLVFVIVWRAVVWFADEWWPATVLVFAPGWWLLLPAAVLVPAAALVCRRSLGPLLLAVVLAGAATHFSFPVSALSRSPDGFRVRLLTCNMHYTENLDPVALNQLLDETRPDVVLLQEWKHPNPSGALVLPNGDWHTHQTEQVRSETLESLADKFVLASRFPIRRTAVLGRYSMSPQGAVIRYELETAAGPVTVFNVHLATPRDGLQAVLRAGGDGPAKVQAGSDVRREQSAGVAQAAGTARPVLIAGDLNTPPQSARFRREWNGYTDAFSSAGWGWGHTFFTRNAAVRVDHILTGPGWRCDRCWVGPDVGSPHRPVLADLVWSPSDGR